MLYQLCQANNHLFLIVTTSWRCWCKILSVCRLILFSFFLKSKKINVKKKLLNYRESLSFLMYSHLNFFYKKKICNNIIFQNGNGWEVVHFCWEHLFPINSFVLKIRKLREWKVWVFKQKIKKSGLDSFYLSFTTNRWKRKDIDVRQYFTSWL